MKDWKKCHNSNVLQSILDCPEGACPEKSPKLLGDVFEKNVVFTVKKSKHAGLKKMS